MGKMDRLGQGWMWTRSDTWMERIHGDKLSECTEDGATGSAGETIAGFMEKVTSVKSEWASSKLALQVGNLQLHR